MAEMIRTRRVIREIPTVTPPLSLCVVCYIKNNDTYFLMCQIIIHFRKFNIYVYTFKK